MYKYAGNNNNKVQRGEKPFHASTITIVLLLAFVGNKCKMENGMFLNRRRKIQENTQC